MPTYKVDFGVNLRGIEDLAKAAKSLQDVARVKPKLFKKLAEGINNFNTTIDRSKILTEKQARALKNQSIAALNTARASLALKKAQDDQTKSVKKSRVALRALRRGFKLLKGALNILDKATGGSLRQLRRFHGAVAGIASALTIYRVMTKIIVGFMNIWKEAIISIPQIHRVAIIASSSIEQLGQSFALVGLTLGKVVKEVPVPLSNMVSNLAEFYMAGMRSAEAFKVIAKFSYLTGVSISNAALQFAHLISIFHKAEEDIVRMANVIWKLGKTSAASFKEIFRFTEQVGAAVAPFKLSYEAAAALSATMASLGMRMYASRTAILKILKSMTEQTLLWAHLTGKSMFQWGRGIEENVTQSLTDALEAMHRLVTSGDIGRFLEVLDELGLSGVRVATGVFALINSYDEFLRKFDLAVSAYKKQTGIIEDFQAATNNLVNQWQIFKNIFKFEFLFNIEQLSRARVELDTLSQLINDVAAALKHMHKIGIATLKELISAYRDLLGEDLTAPQRILRMAVRGAIKFIEIIMTGTVIFITTIIELFLASDLFKELGKRVWKLAQLFSKTIISGLKRAFYELGVLLEESSNRFVRSIGEGLVEALGVYSVKPFKKLVPQLDALFSVLARAEPRGLLSILGARAAWRKLLLDLDKVERSIRKGNINLKELNSLIDNLEQQAKGRHPLAGWFGRLAEALERARRAYKPMAPEVKTTMKVILPAFGEFRGIDEILSDFEKEVNKGTEGLDELLQSTSSASEETKKLQTHQGELTKSLMETTKTGGETLSVYYAVRDALDRMGYASTKTALNYEVLDSNMKKVMTDSELLSLVMKDVKKNIMIMAREAGFAGTIFELELAQRTRLATQMLGDFSNIANDLVFTLDDYVNALTQLEEIERYSVPTLERLLELQKAYTAALTDEDYIRAREILRELVELRRQEIEVAPKTGPFERWLAILARSGKKWGEFVRDMKDGAQAIDQTIEQSLSDAIYNVTIGTESMEEALRGFLNAIYQALMRWAADIIASKIIEVIGTLLAGLIPGLFGGATVPAGAPKPKGLISPPPGYEPAPWGGMAQRGGIIQKPAMVLAGEVGPEAIVPLRGGAIPVKFAGRSQQPVNINLVINAVDARSVSDLLIQPENRRTIEGIIGKAVKTRGTTYEAIRGTL